MRIQLLLTSNIKERERYAAEKLKIQVTAQAVRDNTNDLRVQLEEAQKMLALRKEYDEMAEKITSNRLLRPREEQHANLHKLNTEIAELERESQEYAQTWAERRQQFGRIIEEGMQLRRQIRDEKEEVERREGMENREDGDDGEAASIRGRSSGTGTPRPIDGGATPLHSSQQLQEQQETGPGANGLSVIEQNSARGKTPLRTMQSAGEDGEGGSQRHGESEDTDMAEDGEVSPESGDSDLSSAPPDSEMIAIIETDGHKGHQRGEEQGLNNAMDTS